MTDNAEKARRLLLERLAHAGFAEDYRQLCMRHPEGRNHGAGAKPLRDQLARTGARTRTNTRFGTIDFHDEEIGGWRWVGRLHVQRSGLIEPMLEARSPGDATTIGSTWLDLAIGSGALSTPTLPATDFLPPHLPCNRPLGGDPERLARDVLALFGRMKDAIRPVWGSRTAPEA